MSALVGHFVLSPREREKRDSRKDEREGQGRKRNRNESKETEEIKTFALYPYLLQGKQTLPNFKPKSVGCPSEGRLTELGFNDRSTLMGHFVSSPRERKKRDKREGLGRKRKMNESEGTEEIKTNPLYHYLLQG